jgi:hypothetical protein
MRLTKLNERPSAFTAACAPAHAFHVGRLAVADVPASRWRLVQGPVAFNQLSMQYESVQLQDAQARILGINGRTAKATGMAQSPIFAGVQASGVPPRGRPV